MSDAENEIITTGYRNLTHPTLTMIPSYPVEDPAIKKFKQMTHHQKDLLSCDEIFCLYLREICRKVNEIYYRTVLRFVLLYRECMNEYGWIKRRETLNRAKVTEEMDDILWQLKTKETAGEQVPEEASEESKTDQDIYIP